MSYKDLMAAADSAVVEAKRIRAAMENGHLADECNNIAIAEGLEIRGRMFRAEAEALTIDHDEEPNI